MPYIYRIKNKKNDKMYIGSTCDLERRWKTHKNRLDEGYHSNTHLMRSWDKHGGGNFEFEIVEKVQEENKTQNTTYKKLSKEYPVSPSSIRMIVKGRRWPHAAGPIKGEDC